MLFVVNKVNERIKILIRKNKKKKEILFKYYDQFELMFGYIFKNYKKYKIKSMFNQQILTNNQLTNHYFASR